MHCKYSLEILVDLRYGLHLSIYLDKYYYGTNILREYIRLLRPLHYYRGRAWYLL